MTLERLHLQDVGQTVIDRLRATNWRPYKLYGIC